MLGRVALVVDDRVLANAVQEHLQKHLGQRVFVCPYESIGEHLASDTDGLLLLVAGPADDDKAWRLVQDI